MQGQAQFPKESGWRVDVWFPHQEMHNVSITNPNGQPISVTCTGDFIWRGLNSSLLVDILVCVGKLRPTDTDAEAVDKIRGCFPGFRSSPAL